MSSINGNGKGNLLISYLFKNDNAIKQIEEESILKEELAKVLSSKGYKFIIADDEFINEKLLND